jgi:hypothetical protein
MAKQKTKRGPIETVATQESGTYSWEFTTGVYNWRWSEHTGMNLEVREGQGDYQPCLYAKNLDHAIMFAYGFEGGVEAERRKVRITV